ncbi:4Fe-4S binding protein [Candidatus Aminicenantes bacterium AC-334-K16]|nr:4Fe-4S binding protein [Candidatus Aminicenantes bacterium AC-334-K16]
MSRKKSKTYRLLQLGRIFFQTAFFLLFFILLLQTRFPGEDYIGNVEIFFHFDPLIALTTFFASRLIFPLFLFSIITLGMTLLLGRVFCGWVCPFGAIQQFFSFLFKKLKWLKIKTKSTFSPKAWKYYLLVFLLMASLLGLDLVGLFDPFSLLYRSFITSLLPALAYIFSAFISLVYQLHLFSLGDTLVQFYENLGVNPIFLQALGLGLLFIGIILLNLKKERFWCRYLCPLGALLGIFSRWNRLKLKLDEDKCIKCSLCTLHCETDAVPYPREQWTITECVYCFTCGAICPTAAISFPFVLTPQRTAMVNLSRRKLLATALLGALAVPFFRLSPARVRASAKRIRPPGALPEEQFLQKCVKCGECMKVCPTNGLQPAFTEAGPEGIWTPILVPRIGHCEYYCTLCTQVCPTGAIQELRVEDKATVKIGSAWVDKNRCIPWKIGEPCIVCEEHCPVSPKAIKLVEITVRQSDGTIKTERAPFVELEQCTGCGICENKCPVVDQPAIYITSVGESRSETNQVLLQTTGTGSGPF